MLADKRRIKLVFFVSEDWYFWSHRLPLARSAIDRGWKVYLVTRVSTYQRQIEDLGIRVIPLRRFKRGFQHFFKDLLSLFEILRIYQLVNPDIVQHVALKPIVFGTFAAHMTHIGCVFNTFAGMGSLFTTMGRQRKLLADMIYLVFKFLFKPSSVRLIFQNASDRDGMVNRNVVKKEKTALIKGSGVNVVEFQPTENPGEIPIVLLASRMLWDKGIGEFVEAAKLVNAKSAKARFVLAGSPDLENPTTISQMQLKQWHQSGLIEWWGFQDNMADVLSKVHIFCLPSYREGLPKAILEACASGIPVITTDTIGCRDIVRHGVNGLLVPTHDVDELAKAIEDLIENPERRQALGRQGRALVENEYAEDIVIDQTFHHYLNMVTSRKTQPSMSTQNSM